MPDNKKDYEQVYDDFWKDLVENEDGTLNLDQLKRELSDYYLVMGEVSKVYDTLTFGHISKVTTAAHHVIAEVEEQFRAQYEDDNDEWDEYQAWLREQEVHDA